jgi:competence protein ComEA
MWVLPGRAADLTLRDMIDDPLLGRQRARHGGRAARLDFDHLDELDDPLLADDDPADVAGGGAIPDGARTTGGRGLLVRVLRPWFDPRPGELRGAIVVLAGGLVLSTALWFDASRRPKELAETGFAAIIPVGTDEGWDVGPTGATPPSLAQVIVHVSGAVLDPGLVTLPGGSRVGDALEAAGGAQPTADLARLNLARMLVDGEQVHVYREGEEASPASGSPSRGVLADGRIDINRASAEELTTLPGIGPARAQAIIAAREERPFDSPGDLRRVSGIGEVTFQRLAPLIAAG